MESPVIPTVRISQKRPSPLTVRISPAEIDALTNAALAIGTSRNHLVRSACASMIRDLKSENLVGAIQ
jgi:uncharacterized protein (DUF1778 family)